MRTSLTVGTTGELTTKVGPGQTITLGEMLIEVGEFEEARSILKTAISRTPNKATTLHLASHYSILDYRRTKRTDK